MRYKKHVALIREIRNPYKIIIGRPEGKRPLERDYSYMRG
jgi:hypothetical protein